jgi:cell pole-organizing protein PopZ
MADVTDANSSSEPSMEEILASIRRIIADEKDPNAVAAPEASDDVIELTQVVQQDGSIADLQDEPPAMPEVKMPEPEPFTPAPLPEPVAEDRLVSDMTAQTATSALETLAHKVEVERRVAPTSYTPIGNGSRTLEEMVLELLKPMLKGWLDENLTPIVERIVQKEVERIARRVQE